MSKKPKPLELWLAALGLFGLAALTGAGFRWSMLLGVFSEIGLADIRHAHSHLMYMGWATPAAAILIGQLLTDGSEKDDVGWRWPVLMMLLTAAIAYPVFLAFGYRSVPVGGVELPLAAMIGALSLVSWYWWLFKLRRILVQPTNGMAGYLWGLAGFFLLLSSFGAWARGMLPRLGLTGPLWEAIALHWFLDMFAEGWLLLALLGLVYALLDEKEGPEWANYLLSAGLPLAFLMGIPAGQLPLVELRWLARFAGGMVAIGTLVHVFHLWQKASRTWLLVLTALTIKAGLQLGDALFGSGTLLAEPGIRILYLHVLLLAAFSLGAAAAADSVWGGTARILVTPLALAIWLLLISLLPLAELWPFAGGGRWPLMAAAIAATLPALVVLASLFQIQQK